MVLSLFSSYHALKKDSTFNIIVTISTVLWYFRLLVWSSLMPIYLIHAFGLCYLCSSRTIWGDRTEFTIKITCVLFDIGGIWRPLVAVWTPDLMSIAFFVIIMVITSRGPRPT